MNDKYHRSKNKWQSQFISKRFKNRHLNDEYRNKHIPPKENANLFIKDYQNESTESIDNICSNNHSNTMIPSWSCKRCTYYNVESTSYCLICELPFNSNHTVNNPTTTPLMADYLQPILNQIETKQDDFDEEMQFAIALSLQNITSDSDDTDDAVSPNTTNTVNTSKNKHNKPIINNKKRKNKTRGISFDVYWQEMAEYNALFQKNLKYIIKQNKLRMMSSENGTNTLWEGHGSISSDAFNIIQQNEELMSCIPSINTIYGWLGTHWNVKDFTIKNIMNSGVLQKFVRNGKIKKGHLQIVYHGTNSCNDQGIINNGLIVGGTKGVPVANGRAYGTGVYCSPSLSTARSYERGSLFICLVRTHRCTKSGTIYVVPNDDDIVPLYLSSFSYYGVSIANNTIFRFKPGWKPLNVNIKASKERRVKRKWSAYHKLKN